MTRYRLNMDVIDVTTMAAPAPRCIFSPYVPSRWDRPAFLRFLVRMRWGWHSNAAKRCTKRAAAGTLNGRKGEGAQNGP